MLTFYIFAILTGCVIATPYKDVDKDDMMICQPRSSSRHVSKRVQDYPPEKPYETVEYEPLPDDEYEQPQPSPLEKEETEYIPLPRKTSRKFKPRGKYTYDYDSMYVKKPSGRPRLSSNRYQPTDYVPDSAYESDLNQGDTEGEQSEGMYDQHQAKDSEPPPPPPRSSTFERIQPSRQRKSRKQYRSWFAEDAPISSSRREYEPEDAEESKYVRAPSRPQAKPVTSCDEDDENYGSAECDCS